MRRQELIDVQTPFEGIRNKVINNVNTSSDVCVFTSPMFDVSGASKIVSGATSSSDFVYILTGETAIELYFEFTDNFDEFSSNDLTFSYDIYKYNKSASVFDYNTRLTSSGYKLPSFSGTSGFSASVLVSDLNVDGEYLIKGSYNYNICTDILGRLGVRNSSFISRFQQYELYDEKQDYYFIAIESAQTPNFEMSPQNETSIGSLTSVTYYPATGTSFTLEGVVKGFPIVTLNGLTLSEGYDYELTEEKNIILSASTNGTDILTITYVSNEDTNGLITDKLFVNSSIVSGPTDGQGNEKIYYNTTTNKYEYYLLTEPVDFNDVIFSINGVTLTKNLDYSQSSTNKRRIILYGSVVVGDLINVSYNSSTNIVGSITSNSIDLYWSVAKLPQTINGQFAVQVSMNDNFTSLVDEQIVQYNLTNKTYSKTLALNYPYGTKLYYRVKNTKNYVTLKGDTITDISYSEVIPITIKSNSTNSY